MKVPLSWLEDYVDITVPVEELAHRLTMVGTEVAGVAAIGEWRDCYVGSVTKVERHPNADRLTLCTVDIGDEEMRVVCGAPNVAEEQKIAFAKVGAELIDAHTGKMEPLKAARIRGRCFRRHDLLRAGAWRRRGPQRHTRPGRGRPWWALPFPTTWATTFLI